MISLLKLHDIKAREANRRTHLASDIYAAMRRVIWFGHKGYRYE